MASVAIDYDIYGGDSPNGTRLFSHGSALYLVTGYDPSGTPYVRIYKSTNSGASWSNVGGDGPQMFDDADFTVACVGDKLWVFSEDDSSYNVNVTAFDMATDAWGATTTGPECKATPSFENALIYAVARSTGEIVLVHWSAMLKVARFDPSAVTWTAAVTVDATLPSDAQAQTAVVDAADRVHILAFSDGQDKLYEVTMRADNTFSTNIEIMTGPGQHFLWTASDMYVFGSQIVIAYADRLTPGSMFVATADVADSPSFSASTFIDGLQPDMGAKPISPRAIAISELNGDLFLFWIKDTAANDQPSFLLWSRQSGGTWSDPQIAAISGASEQMALAHIMSLSATQFAIAYGVDQEPFAHWGRMYYLTFTPGAGGSGGGGGPMYYAY